MKLCCSEEDMIQNLRDAGCSEKDIEAFMECVRCGREPESLRLLKRQRSRLLDAVHEEQKKLDCLDYLVYQMQKADKR